MKKDFCYEIADDMIFYLELKTTLDGLDPDELCQRQKGESDRAEYQKNLEVELTVFCRLCQKYDLPLCNPIAFFNALLADENWKKIDPIDLKKLLQRALGGDGFIFSSVFDRFPPKSSAKKRPVDCVKSLVKSSLSRAISEQVKLNGWCDYQQQQIFLTKEVFQVNLEDFLVYQHWVAEAKESKELPDEKANLNYRFQLENSLYEQIFEIYEKYCILQLGDTPNSKEVTAIKEDLSEILEVMTFLTELHSFYLELQEILSESEDILAEKNQWLTGFSEYLKQEVTKKRILLAEKPLNRKQVSAMGLEDYLVLATMTTPSNDRLKQYPLWDTTKSPKTLSKNDKYALTSYQKHPLFIWRKRTDVALRAESMKAIAPLYFTTQLMHKKNPTNNFDKKEKTFHLADPSISFNAEVSQDYQICHRVLLKDLMSCFKDNGYLVNERVCVHLFTQEQNILIQRNNKKASTELTKFLENLLPCESLNILYFHIEKTLSLLNVELPEYTEMKSVLGGQMALKAYSKEDMKENNNVLKKLKTLVTPALAQEYCDKFLSPHDGLGVGLHSREWHLSLAKWLDNIIDLDDDLVDFVEPSEDMMVPGTYTTVAEQNQIQEENGGDTTVCTARLTPNLSQVQVTIQRLCIDMVVEKLSKEVFVLYKSLFWNFKLLRAVAAHAPII